MSIGVKGLIRRMKSQDNIYEAKEWIGETDEKEERLDENEE